MRVWSVLRKEMREALRDFHVLLYSVGFPLLFYPLLVWAMFQVALLEEGQVERTPPRVALEGAPELEPVLFTDPIARVDAPVGGLLTDQVDVVVIAHRDGAALKVELHHQGTRSRSRRALKAVQERLDDYRATRLEVLARRHGLDPGLFSGWEVEKENAAPPDQMRAWLISQTLPAMVVLIMLIGALYPAVEVVVGERERGTLETTLSAAAPRAAVMAGKMLTVMCLTLIAAVGNGAAMVLTVLHLSTLSQGAVPSLPDLSDRWGMLALALPNMIGAAALVSAVMLTAVLPARTFKAGQNAGTVALTAGLALAAVALVPMIRLTPALALLPLGSSALVMRDALNGELSLLCWALSTATTWGLTALLVRACVRVVESEAFLFRAAVPPWLAWLERAHDRG